MAKAARDAMGRTRLRAVADRGYYSGPQIKACADAGIAVILPKPATSGAKAHGRFDSADFIYIARDDEYQCPAGERAIYRYTREEHGLQLRRYWSTACSQCAIKSLCTPSSERRITRWERESVLEAVQRRLDKTPDAMTVRRRTVEHAEIIWKRRPASRGPLRQPDRTGPLTPRSPPCPAALGQHLSAVFHGPSPAGATPGVRIDVASEFS
jgi:hypothetical protein